MTQQALQNPIKKGEKSISTRRHILTAALALTGLLAVNTNAQDKAKGKGMTFHGKVEAVTDKGLCMDSIVKSMPCVLLTSLSVSYTSDQSWHKIRPRTRKCLYKLLNLKIWLPSLDTFRTYAAQLVL